MYITKNKIFNNIFCYYSDILNVFFSASLIMGTKLVVHKNHYSYFALYKFIIKENFDFKYTNLH